MSWIESIIEVALGPHINEEFLKEKRITPRINCDFPVEFIYPEGKTLDGFIVAIEHTGMRVLLQGRFKKGEKIGVSLKEPSALTGEPDQFNINMVYTEVVWCRKKRYSPKYYAGLRFVDSPEVLADSWVFFVLSSFGLHIDQTYHERRAKLRLEASIPLVCHYGEDSSSPGVASDIGLDGLKMRLAENLAPDEIVRLDIGPFKFFPVMSCSAKITRSTPDSSKKRFEIGAEFIALDNKQIKSLGSLVKELIRDSNI